MNRIYISELRTGARVNGVSILLQKSERHAKFLAPCVVYPCQDLLREVVSALLKF